MFGCLLGWYTICTFSGDLAPRGIFAMGSRKGIRPVKKWGMVEVDTG